MSDAIAQARDAAYAMALADLNPAQPALFQADAHWSLFERLRKEDPVHFTPQSDYGPYWSIVKYNDILAVDTNHQIFSSSSEFGGITILDRIGNEAPLPMFIAMDPPKHDIQRKAVSPAFTPASIAAMEPVIRERAGKILDSLPIGEEFDWVDKVSIELSTMTLATLFDFPMAERRRLTRWSDVITAPPGFGIVDTIEQKLAEMQEMAGYFMGLWNARVNAPPRGDLISMLAHAPATRAMEPREYFGNVVLLTVGGNDTTRSSISGSLLALNRFPGEYEKLRANPALIPSMVSETIRWQTPLAHMRRTALCDFEFRGQQIKKGDKVVMWYVSGNRDEDAIENPDAFVIDRQRPREHMSFGFGIHRCIGSRLAELQLRVIWEEIMKRFPEVRVVGEPRRNYSVFVKGYERMTALIPHRA
jgi:cytochrome P450